MAVRLNCLFNKGDLGREEGAVFALSSVFSCFEASREVRACFFFYHYFVRKEVHAVVSLGVVFIILALFPLLKCYVFLLSLINVLIILF